MNILNTQTHSLFKTGGENPTGNAMDVLGNQLVLDPETIKLLQQKSKAEGLDFQQLLQATKEGKDPEAFANLLEAQQGETQQAGIPVANHNEAEIVEKTPAFMQPEKLNATKLDGESEVSTILNLPTKGDRVAAQTQINNANPAQVKTQAGQVHMVSPEQGQMNTQTAAALALTSQALQQGDMITPATGKQAKVQMGLEVGKPTNFNPEVTTPEKAKLSRGKLLNLNDFMAKQSPSMQKNAMKSAYKPMNQSIFNQKVQESLPGVVKKPTMSTNTEVKSLQDVMFGGQPGTEVSSEALAQNITKPNAAAMPVTSTAKVFDINQIANSTSTDDVIAKVQDYIIQSRASGKPEVQMSFKHSELGQIDLHVIKQHNNELNIMIGTRTFEGARFFNQHQADLLQTLTQSGIQVADLKLDTNLSTNNSNLANSDSEKQQFSQESKGQHNSESGQRDSEQRKRKELWEQFQGEEAA